MEWVALTTAASQVNRWQRPGNSSALKEILFKKKTALGFFQCSFCCLWIIIHLFLLLIRIMMQILLAVFPFDQIRHMFLKILNSLFFQRFHCVLPEAADHGLSSGRPGVGVWDDQDRASQPTRPVSTVPGIFP